MAKKKPSVAIFNTINLLKASVIFLAIFHLFWKLLEPPFWYPPLDKGAMAFIGALLILLCLVACSGSLLWGFGQTIKQVFAPCHTGTLAVDKSPSFYRLFCYLISYLLIFVLSYYLGENAHPFFFIFISLPVFVYALANAIGAFIIIILKVIHQSLLLKRGYTAFASKPPAWLTSKKVDTDKLSNKNLLIRAAICLFVVTCSNSLINKGIIIPDFKGDLIDIVLSVVMLLNFVFYWYYSLLVFIRAIKSSFAPNGLVDYLTFSSGYYLLAVSVLLPLGGRLSLSTSDHLGLFFIVYFSLYIILNYIGALIILLIQALKICLSK